MSAVGAVFLVAVLLIVLALVYFLVSTILALRKITAGLDEVIERRRRDRREERAGQRRRDRDQRAARRGRASCSRACSSRRPGMTDAMGLVEGLYPGAAAAGPARLPREHRRRRRRGSARSTRGARSRSRGSGARRRSPR